MAASDTRGFTGGKDFTEGIGFPGGKGFTGGSGIRALAAAGSSQRGSRMVKRPSRRMRLATSPAWSPAPK